MAEVAQSEGAKGVGGREIVDLLADMPVVAVPAERGIVLRDGGVRRDVAIQEVEREGAQEVGHGRREAREVGQNRFAEIDVGSRGPGVRLLWNDQDDEPHAQHGEREAGEVHERLGTRMRLTRPSMPLPRRSERSAAARSNAVLSTSSCTTS